MRRTILFLALSGLFATLAILANAQKSIDQEPINTPSEIISLRTENSETYDNHNGTHTMKVFSGRKYYKDNGKLKKISLSVKNESVDGYSHAVRSGEYTYRFDPADKNKGYSFSRGSFYVKYIPAGDWTGITELTTPTENGVKEDIIFTPDASPTVSWRISTNAAVSFYDGVLTFTDSDYNFLFRIPAAYAFDSAERNIPVTASFTGDMLSYTLSIPENAAWPVTLDPSTEITAQHDGRVHRYDNDTYQNVRDYVNAGMVNYTVISAGQWYESVAPNMFVFRGYLSFPIPGVYSVEACSLYINGKSDSSTDDYEIYIVGASEYAPVLDAYDYLLFDGQQSGSAYTGTVLNNTWNSSSYSSDWNTFVFNSSGRDSVVAATSDTLWIAMISKNDYDNVAPTGEEYIYFENSSHATDKPYLSITYTPSKKPYNFTMTALDSTTIACSWEHNGDNEDKFYIVNQADSSIVDSTTVDALADTVSGLDWNTQYVWAAVADSSGTKWFSDPDSTYSLTGPPSEVSFFDYRSSHFSMGFDKGQNPDSTKFTVRIVINSDTLYWNDALGDTTSTGYSKTDAAWGDSITIGGNGFLDADTVYSMGIHGQNADSLWSENWYTLKTSEAPSLVTINLTGTPDKLYEFKNAAVITDYGAARSVAGSDSIDFEVASPELGQLFDSSDYFLKRLGLEAVLPEGYEARAGSLYFYVTGDSTDTDSDVTAFDGDWSGGGYDDEAFWNFDGRQTGTTAHNGTGLFETFNTSSISANNWYYWIYNEEGLSILASALGDTLRNTIISARDSSASAPSGNEFFTIDPDSSYITFSIDLPDTLPGNFSITTVSTDSILAEWTDSSHSEEQYLIVNLADSSAVSDTLSANSESTTIGGLSVNTQYKFMLKVLGGNLGGQYSNPDSTYTLANVPGKPSISFAYGDVQDESGLEHNGSVMNAVLIENERAAGNHAYGFNGTNTYITIPDTTDFDFTNSFTLACRIKRTGDNTGYNRVITYENTLAEGSYRLMFNNANQLFSQINNGATVTTGVTSVLTENVWYHIAATYDGSYLKIYVDGDSTHVSPLTSGDITLYANRKLTIGESPAGAAYFNGYLDDVRIYNTALPPAQIDSLYTYDMTEYDQSNLILHYSFDYPDLIIFSLNANNNPSYTHFAVQDSVSGYYIDATAEPESLSTQPLGEWGWRTYGEWGAALGDSLSGITPGNLYVLRAKARNGE